MATINDIVTGALKRAELVDAIEAAEAHQTARGVDLLNQMMQALKGRGINVMWATQTLTSTFPLADEHVEGVTAMLAARELTDHHGRAAQDRSPIESK